MIQWKEKKRALSLLEYSSLITASGNHLIAILKQVNLLCLEWNKENWNAYMYPFKTFLDKVDKRTMIF